MRLLYRRYVCMYGLSIILSSLALRGASAQVPSPGNAPYIPTRIDWLTTTLQASLRTDMTTENKFQLEITSPDSETILIYVRYLPDVDRQTMNISIDGARKVIAITVLGYGWTKWLKVKEDIAMIGK